MSRRTILAAGVAALFLAFDAAPAGAWVAAHAGYTRVTPYGVQHAGRTTVATPYGVRTTGSAYHAGYGGYRAGYAYGYGYRAPVAPVYPVRPVAPVGGVYGAGVYRRY